MRIDTKDIMRELNETAHRLLDVAEQYTQKHGFNAFSYKDIQNEVGVKTSSIHYYFPTKHDLAIRMTERYVERSRKMLKGIAKENKCGLKRLDALGKIYIGILNNNQFCLCGMLASDMTTLPDIISSKLDDFFSFTQEWVAESIELAKDQGTFSKSVHAENAAAQFVAVLEGGMLIARVKKDTTPLQTLITNTFTSYTPSKCS